MLRTMLASGRANLLRYDPNGIPPWRPLTDDSPASGTTAHLQLYEQQGAQFMIVAKHLQTNAELLVMNLNNVQYNIQSDTKHDITLTNGNMYQVQFNSAEEGGRFSTIVNNTMHEIKRAGTGASQGAYRRPAPPPPAPKRPSTMSGRQADSRLDVLYEQLKRAIASGDVGAATDFAKALAESRAQLDATTVPRPGSYKDQLINVKVHLEDKVSSGGVISLQVKPSTNVAALKKMMLDNFNFPEQIQNWIIGKRLARDEETLANFGIKSSGASVYLYFVSAASVGLTREQFEEQRHPGPLLSPINGGQDFAGAAAANPYNASNNRIIQNNLIDLTASPVAGAGAAAAAVVGNVAQRPTLATPPRPPLPAHQRQTSVLEVRWTCPSCTFLNPPTRPGCEMCSADRPVGFEVPDDYVPMGTEKERLKEVALHEQLFAQAKKDDEERNRTLREINFRNILDIEKQQDLIPNVEEFDCSICFAPVEIGGGVILRDCLHTFCRECLSEHINFNEEAAVMCPFKDDVHSCQFPITEREIKALVTTQQFQKYLQQGLHTAENQAADSYHCKTPDCPGWCYYEDDNNKFHCPVCHQPNCLTCKAIHHGMNCKQYQDDLRRRADNDVAAKQTQELLERLVADGEALHCPRCNVILQKKEGCDWLRCTMCKIEICWVTKGPRWGPEGQGDISGGCRCRVNNQKCHPNCRNCH